MSNQKFLLRRSSVKGKMPSSATGSSVEIGELLLNNASGSDAENFLTTLRAGGSSAVTSDYIKWSDDATNEKKFATKGELEDNEFVTANALTQINKSAGFTEGGISKLPDQQSLTDAIIELQNKTQDLEESDPIFTDSPAAGIADDDIENWNNKQDTISDLGTIRSNASNGATAYSWGNHANAGYLSGYTEQYKGTVTSVKVQGTNGLTGGNTVTASGTITISGITATSAATGVSKLVTGNLSGKTYTAGEAAAAAHTHSQYLTGYTEQYKGTITGINMNGESKGTSGVVDLGTVLTSTAITVSGSIISTSASTANSATTSVSATTAVSATNATNLGGRPINDFMTYEDSTNYVNANFNDALLDKKAADTYIEYRSSNGGWYNSKWGTVSVYDKFIGNLQGTAVSATTSVSAVSAITSLSAITAKSASTVTNRVPSASTSYSAITSLSATTAKSASTVTNRVPSASTSYSATTAVSATTAASATIANKVDKSLIIGAKSYNGSSEVTITLPDLGLETALKYHGKTSTPLYDGATTNPIKINNKDHFQSAGCVVIYESQASGSTEFVWSGSKWEKLGEGINYKTKQTAVSDPSPNNTSYTFIDTISQDTNGVIKPTKKSVPTGTTATTGVVKLVYGDLRLAQYDDGVAAAGGHTHSQYLTSLPSHNHDDRYYTENEINTKLAEKADSGHTHPEYSKSDSATTETGHYTPSKSANTISASSGKYISGIRVDSKSHVIAVTEGNLPSDTHHQAKIIVGSSSSSTTDGKAEINGNVWLNLIENNIKRSDTNIKGSGATIVTADSNGNIIITSTDTDNDTKVTSVGNHYTPSSSTTKGTTATTSNNYIKGIRMDAKGHVTDVITGTPINSDTATTESGHYSPTGKTSTYSGGWITGIKLDSKKHVTEVTTASTAHTHSQYSPTGHTHSEYATTTALNDLISDIEDNELVISTIVTKINDSCGFNENSESVLPNGQNLTDAIIELQGHSHDKVNSATTSVSATTAKSASTVTSRVPSASTSYSATTAKSASTVTSRVPSASTSYSATTAVSATNATNIKTAGTSNSKLFLLGQLNSGSTTYYGVYKNVNVYMENGSLYASSDKTLKTHVENVNGDPELIKRIPKAYFHWNDDKGKNIQMGTYAQDLEEVYPELVTKGEDGIRGVAYDRLGVVALAGIDKLYEMIQQLQAKNDELENRIKELENK